MTGLAAGVAAFGLDRDRAICSEPLAQGDWDRLLATVRQQRIEGLLAAAVHAGALPVAPEQRDAVREMARGRANVDLLLERELLGVAAHFASEDIPFRVLKGLAWCHTVYPDPSWRGSGDVDLLVDAKDWYRAVGLLEGQGMHRITPELRSGFDARFGKDATFDTPAGWEVDLHRVLVLGPYGLWVDERELIAEAVTVRIGGRELQTLDLVRSFIHACYNAVLTDDPPRLIALRDVAQMAVSGVDGVAARQLARRWRGERVVALAVRRSQTVLGVDLSDTPVGAELAPVSLRLQDRALLACHRGPARGYTTQMAGVIAVGGLRGRLEYLTALARPGETYLTARGWSGSSPLRQGLVRVRRGRRRSAERTSADGGLGR